MIIKRDKFKKKKKYINNYKFLFSIAEIPELKLR